MPQGEQTRVQAPSGVTSADEESNTQPPPTPSASIAEMSRERIQAKPTEQQAVPQRMSNSTSRNGTAHLFLTTLTSVRDPTHSSLTLTGPSRRTLSRTLARVKVVKNKCKATVYKMV